MTSQRRASIWDRDRVWVTAGAVALIFLAAMESLAVTTVMPVVSDALDGESLYAVAFAGTLAASVIGMVAAGAWSDARGPRGALYAAASLFLIGLIVSGLALTMHAFLLGRLIQGLGSGGQIVALYVVVARLYPPQLHGRMFAAFAAAWIVPSMIGPFLAGAVAEFLDWRWTFLGVAGLTAVAFVTIAARLRGMDLGAGGAAGAGRTRVRLLLAVVVATAAVIVGVSADAPPQLGWPIAACATLVIAFAVLPLLPSGTLRAAPGLPSVVLLRGMICGAFFAGEAYIPYLLMDGFDFTPTWSGVALMFGALAWAGGSGVQGLAGDRLGNARTSVISVCLLTAALVGLVLTALFALSPVIVMIGWTLAGAGMGLLYPRLTALTLAYSEPSNQGFNSAALSISEAGASAVALALAGLGFASVGAGSAAFAAVFAFCCAIAVAAAVPGSRLGHAAERVAR